MKTKHLLLTLLFLIATTVTQAQLTNTQFTEAGIAVQGIARDDTNTAISNQDVELTFEFFYLTDLIETEVLAPFTQTVTTDAFGVFSTIINPDYRKNQIFSNYQVSLRIKKGTTILSNSILKHVPYAISANNGVPTGSIMPFIGKAADVPIGWMLCNGDQIPAEALKLKALLAPSTALPNLQGMFLRGVGTNALTTTTTNLGEVQDDAYKNHSHADNFTTSQAGAHSHTMSFNLDEAGGTDNSILKNYIDQPDQGTQNRSTNSAGQHSHTISGSVSKSTSGIDAETRPVNFGVNYIIKL